jgi:O-acetyl-ADP-ribose deacetylase (regulator of RNase III)
VTADSDPRECPYVGLEPFEPAHAEYFFGRQLDSRVLADHVSARPITVLYGATGIGKSSLINVGLPAALDKSAMQFQADENADEIPRWKIIPLRSWQNPGNLNQLLIDAINIAVPNTHRLAQDAPGSTLISTVVEVIRKTKQPFLFILDQFEEYFLYGDPDTKREFESGIGTLALNRDLPIHLLFVLRHDGLHLLDELRAHIPAILDTTIELGPLNDRAVEEAIRAPVTRYNQVYREEGSPIVIEDRLVSTLIRQLKEPDSNLALPDGAQMQQRVIELPYLQLALTKIWNAEEGPNAHVLREATLIDASKLGGVRKIVEDHVNDVMDRLTVSEKQLCVPLFDRLVTPIGSKIAYPTAGLADRRIVGEGVTPEQVEALLTKLTPKDARILKPVVINGLPGFEIFHDVLAPAVLQWTEKYKSGPVAPRAAAPGALDISTIRYMLRERPGLFIGLKMGRIDVVKGVDIWVNSENTDMLMDRVIGRSISARIRFLGANVDDDGNVLEDTIAVALRRAVGRRGHVKIGTVLVTESGALKESHGVQVIFHVATVEGGLGRGQMPSRDILIRCTEALFRKTETECRKFWRIVRNLLFKKRELQSILIPMIGAGAGGWSVEEVAQSIIPVAIHYLRTEALPVLKEVYFLAFDSRAKIACEQVFEQFQMQGVLDRVDEGP